MIGAWLDGGNAISGIVTYRYPHPKPLCSPLRWWAHQRAFMRRLKAENVTWHELQQPSDWDGLAGWLTAERPDVAITYGFMRRVPDRILKLFPNGGVNFHPTLLPHYRGPQPYQWMAIDNAWRRCAGVTLHVMTSDFDAGQILAHVPFSPADWARMSTRSAALAGSMKAMTAAVIPDYCRGLLKPEPQREGEFPYASGPIPSLVVQSSWSREHLSMLCPIFPRRPGVQLRVGDGLVRLHSEKRIVGPPSGEPPRLRLRSAEFDLADARVIYRRHNSLRRRYEHFRAKVRALRPLSTDMPVHLGAAPAAPERSPPT